MIAGKYPISPRSKTLAAAVVRNNFSLTFIKRAGVRVVLRGLLVFTDKTAEMKRASRGSVEAARFKLRWKYKGGYTSVVNHQGSACIIYKAVYSIVYNLLFLDCLLRRYKKKIKINVTIFSAS